MNFIDLNKVDLMGPPIKDITNIEKNWFSSQKTLKDFEKAMRPMDNWFKHVNKQIAQIDKINDVLYKTSYLGTGKLLHDTKNISSSNLVNFKQRIEGFNKFHKNFIKFNKNLNAMTGQYENMFKSYDRILKSSNFLNARNPAVFPANKDGTWNPIDKMLNRPDAYLRRATSVNNANLGHYGYNVKTANMNIKAFNPAEKAVNEQTKTFKNLLITQGIPQLLGYGGQVWEQYGESRRQGGEILERQGLLSEGLKEFRSGTNHAAIGRGIGQVSGMAGAGAMIGLAGGPVGAWIGAGIGAGLGLAAGAYSGLKDVREVDLKKQEMQWGLARNNEKALTNWNDYYDDEYLTDLSKDYRKRKSNSKWNIETKIGELKKIISKDKERAFDLNSELSDLEKLYGKDFENAPEEIFTSIGKKQVELDEHVKNILKNKKRVETLNNELKAGSRFDTSMRIGNISSATSTGLFSALKGNTEFDISTGHRTSLGYFNAEQNVLAKEHSSISKELKDAKARSDGSEYYRTLIKQLETALVENEKKQYQSGFNKDEMRARMYKMRHGFTLFERDAGVANLMNNQYATTSDYNNKIEEIRGWNTEIDAEIDKVLKMQDSEAKLARLNELNAEKSGNVSTINKLMGANKTDMSNLLRGMVGSSALTDNLGSMSYWAGKTNPVGRLLENGNGLLQQILNVLKESTEQYSPRFQ